MANEPQNPTTPESGAGSDATGIAKFKTPEERDRAYLELEKFSHSQAQRLADLEKKLEAIDTSAPAPDPYQGRTFTQMYPSQQERDQRETELASRLLTKPSEVLREHAQMVRQETIKEMQHMVTNLDAINRFKSDNPDLAKHEEIVAMFVRKQPENLAPAERLRRAAPEARKYISEIAKTSTPTQTPLDPSTYVEAPTSRPAPSAPAVEPTEEDDLSSWIRERSAIQQKKMRV